MGFLSNIFGKKLDPSYVRKWAKEQQRDSRHSNEISLDHVFGGMILGLSSFGKDLKPYSGDASLFEVACYFFFETDLWLYNNRSKYREEASTYFFQKLLQLFSFSLKANNIPELITDRLKHYGEIAMDDNDAESYIDMLSELVRRTKYNTLPQKYDYQDSKAVAGETDEIFDDFFMLKMSLAIYIKHMLQAHYQVLENFFSIADS
jgi:hypothetical protein